MKYILFAEDDETLRNGLVATFESEGYETLGCKDGAVLPTKSKDRKKQRKRVLGFQRNVFG